MGSTLMRSHCKSKDFAGLDNICPGIFGGK